MSIYLLDLPHELIDMVLQCLSRKDLKGLRQCNMVLNIHVTPMIFDSLALYPHSRNCEHLQRVAASPHLRRWVKEMVFDARYLTLTTRIRQRLYSVWSKELPEASKRRLVDRVEALDAGNLVASDPMDMYHFSCLLRRFFKAFSNLQALKVYEMSSTPTIINDWSEMPPFYQWMINITCGQHHHFSFERGQTSLPWTTYVPYTPLLLIALADRHTALRSLNLLHLNASDLSKSNIEKYGAKLADGCTQLRTMNIQFDGFSMANGRATSLVRQLLLKATNIEEVALDFGGERIIADRVSEYDDVRQYVDESVEKTNLEWLKIGPTREWLQSSWPAIGTVHLRGTFATFDEIKAFLLPFSRTLTELSISSLLMKPEQGKSECARSCLVGLLKWVRRFFKLQRVTLAGKFMNGGMQNWDIEPQDPNRPLPEDCLSARVHKYILEGGKCPLNHVAIKPGYYDFRMKTWDSAWPTELLEKNLDQMNGGDDRERQLLRGDNTFSMKYQLERRLDIDMDEDGLSDDDDDNNSEHGEDYLDLLGTPFGNYTF